MRVKHHNFNKDFNKHKDNLFLVHYITPFFSIFSADFEFWILKAFEWQEVFGEILFILSFLKGNLIGIIYAWLFEIFVLKDENRIGGDKSERRFI